MNAKHRILSVPAILALMASLCVAMAAPAGAGTTAITLSEGTAGPLVTIATSELYDIAAEGGVDAASTEFTSPAVPVVEALSSIQGKYTIIWGFEAGGWVLYDPGAPAYVNTLQILETGKGYWIYVTEDCTLVYDKNTYNLFAGWNLIGWLGESTGGTPEVPVAEGLLSIEGKYSESVWAFDAAAKMFKKYFVAAPDVVPEVHRLTTLRRGKGYWVYVTEACTLVYGDNTYNLFPGWNLIGWLG